MDMQVYAPAADTKLLTEYYVKINSLRNTALIETGRLLDEYKAKVEFGDWGPLLKKLGWSRDTGDRFVRVYRIFGDNPAIERAARLRHLPQSAVFMLAAPSTPQKVRDDIIERAQTEQITIKDVKAAIGTKPARKRDDDGDQFTVVDVRNNEACGYGKKGREGIEIYIDESTGNEFRIEQWFTLVKNSPDPA